MMQTMRSAANLRRNEVSSSVGELYAASGFQANEADELSIRRQQLEAEKKGGVLMRFCGVGKHTSGKRTSRLIHPSSPLALSVIMFSAAFQLYASVSSAFYVAFLWSADLCVIQPPTLYLDVLVDSFFLAEILLQFFTGVYVAGGDYIDSLPRVAALYLKGWFLPDLLTSIPVSFVELSYILTMCGADTSDDLVSLRLVRVSKALKLARAMKALRIMARVAYVLKLISSIGEYLRIPPYVLRVMKIAILLMVLVHLCTCGWWLVKIASNSDEDLVAFEETHGLDVSAPWQGLWDKYVLAFYFVNTVLSTIGFGDIAGKNSAERIYCVMLFYVGMLIFGGLLVELQDIFAKASAQSRERSVEINAMIEYLRK